MLDPYRRSVTDSVIIISYPSWLLVENIRRISRGEDRVSLGRVEKGGRGEDIWGRGTWKGGIGCIINNESIVARVAIPVDDGTSIPLARTRSNNFRSRWNAYDYQLQYWYIVAGVIILWLNM